MITHAPYLSLSFFQDFSLFCFFLLPFSCFLSHPSFSYCLHLIDATFHHQYSLFIFHLTRLCLIIFTLFMYLSTITMHYTSFTSPIFTFLSSPYLCLFPPLGFTIYISQHPCLHFCLHLVFVFTYQHYSVFIIYIPRLYIIVFTLFSYLSTWWFISHCLKIT